MSGTPSPKQSSSSGSAASFIKVVQQLIQSDDQQMIIKKMNELQTTFPVLKKITVNMTNQDKLSLFVRDNNFKHKLSEQLLEKFGLEKLPTIKTTVYSIRYRSVIQEELDQTDLVKIFEKFGRISCIYVDKLFAYIQFQSIISSYLAIRTLNEFQIVRDVLKMSVRWSKTQEQIMAQQFFQAKFNAITNAFVSLPKTQKFNCKYIIMFSCPPQFKLVQKIIGPKGNNMKKIFQKIFNQHKIASVREAQKNVKMRLRGKGSGYLEGPNGEQSDQILNFCISAKEKGLYDSTCLETENLLQKLAKDYKFQFQRTSKRHLQGVIYKKHQFQQSNCFETKQLKFQQLPSNLSQLKAFDGNRPTPNQVQENINLRNKARKLGKYRQADQIRQKLKRKGVLLVDSLGKKNNQATTWSYMPQ